MQVAALDELNFHLALHLTFKLSDCLYVNGESRTVRLMDCTPGRFVAARKIRVEFGAIWTCDTVNLKISRVMGKQT